MVLTKTFKVEGSFSGSHFKLNCAGPRITVYPDTPVRITMKLPPGAKKNVTRDEPLLFNQAVVLLVCFCLIHL